MLVTGEPSRRDVDVLVVGGGQSGLAVAYHLHRAARRRERDGRAPLRFVVLDRRDEPGGAWQDGWPSLELFSPAAHSSLPGWPMPLAPGPGNPSARHVEAYLAAYEQRYALPVRRPVRVDRVEEEAAGAGADAGEGARRLLVRTDAGTWRARAVVSATGTWDQPFVPAVPGAASYAGRQLHTAGYRGPDDLAGKVVLVVGGGNSGAQVAADLLPVAARVHWATLRPPRYLPDDVDGRALFETATRAVQDRAAGRPAQGVASLGDIVAVPAVRAARDAGLLVAEPMVERLTPRGARWPDGREERLEAVVWATGFRPALRHLRHLGLPLCDGRPATVAPEGSPHAVRAAADDRLWFVGYGDWAGAASATLVGVNRPARDAVAAIDRQLGG